MCCSFNYLKFRRSVETFVQTQNSCSVEMGSFIFSIVHNILTGLGSLVSFMWFLMNVFYYFILGHSNSWTLLSDLLLTAISAGTTVLAAASFTFGMVLTRGILAKRPVLIRAYFIYGVMVVSICVVTSISLGVTSYNNTKHNSNQDLDAYYGICALIIAGAVVIYSPILAMVWVAFRRVQKQMQYYRPTTTL